MPFIQTGGSAAKNDYDYSTGSGMDGFLSRSLDEVSWETTLGSTISTLGTLPIGVYPTTTTPTNFDSTQVSGSMGGGALSVGGSGDGSTSNGNIVIDGTNGRIAIFDSSGNEVVRLGNLDS